MELEIALLVIGIVVGFIVRIIIAAKSYNRLQLYLVKRIAHEKL